MLIGVLAPIWYVRAPLPHSTSWLHEYNFKSNRTIRWTVIQPIHVRILVTSSFNRFKPFKPFRSLQSSRPRAVLLNKVWAASMTFILLFEYSSWLLISLFPALTPSTVLNVVRFLHWIPSDFCKIPTISISFFSVVSWNTSHPSALDLPAISLKNWNSKRIFLPHFYCMFWSFPTHSCVASACGRHWEDTNFSVVCWMYEFWHYVWG